jgi:hypothetical protein
MHPLPFYAKEKSMKFTLLLFALGQILKVASITNKAFKWYIRNTNARILIKTADGKRARLFIFDKGKFSSTAGNRDLFDAALVFEDAATGFSVLTSKQSDASFNAASEGKLRVEGMSFFAQWFEDGTKLVL